MPRFLFAVLILAAAAFADSRIPNIDFTCDTCSRRHLDSLNVYDRPVIRANQIGFRPADAHKFAFVAEPSAQTFKVIDASNGLSAWEGSLSPLGSFDRPNMWVNGAFNSIFSEYEFGDSDSTTSNKERLYSADFSGLTAPGTYFIVVGQDTSFPFIIDEYLFNAVFETTIKFFGIQRCGNTNSQLHGACHLKDGSSVGYDLTGGWHDCGDHFKVSETLGYTAFVLSLAYNVYSERAEDRFGASYADTVTTDGIPDVLWEAKVGIDYIYKLYKASKASGILAKGDMYHSVGVGSEDHQFWDVPEKQDAQSTSKGGAPRPVATGIGTNTAGMYAAAMAFFAVGWEMYENDHYSDSLIAAAKDIYKNIIAPNPGGKNTDGLLGFYPGNGPLYDDAAAAALGLWYATKDTSYAFDLYKNTAINDNASNYKYNLPYFRGGYLGHTSGFYPGGWMTDFENIHAYVLFAFAKLILPTVAKAEAYGVSSAERDTLLSRTIATMTRLTDDGTQGDSVVSTNPYGSFTVVPPYNLVWTSSDWGFNRYNMGAANAVFMLYDMTGDEQYLNVALDNFYYNMGANPWGLSFIMGAGTRNENHPHNRAANPDGYNAGGMPYEYKCPKGALMGGAAPHKTLKDDWNDYTATETCIDFSAQFVIPGLSLSKKVPEDVEGPVFSNIQGTPITDTSAIVSWDADERSVVTVYYATEPGAAKIDSVKAPGGVGGSVQIDGLKSGETYYFYLVGYDVKKNYTTDDNHGQWYSWTQTATDASISGVTICQVTNNSAKVYWWTGDLAINGNVLFGTSTSELSSMTRADSGKAVRFHEAFLTGLDAGTTYYFDVSSGKTTDNNGGKHYSFKTSEEATFVDFRVYVKPANKYSECTDWKSCNTFFVTVTNSDSIPYSDVELRFYLTKSVQASGWGQLVKVSYDDGATASVVYGTSQFDAASGGYYLPVTISGTIPVSSSFQFELKLQNATYGDIEGSWSLRSHTDSSDPEIFNGIDLTRGPLYTGSESTYLENVDGKNEKAYVKDPYVAIFYHGTQIYGYSPDYDPTSSDLSIARTIDLIFSSPFKTPATSLEDTLNTATYQGQSSVSPSGFLDDFEGNGVSYFGTNTEYVKKYDSYEFSVTRNLAYGNNQVDWVSWHNHGANAKGSYDCACKVVRSNVEWDSITVPPERRYLQFSVDTVRTYIGKRAQVTVTLLDSNLESLAEDITVRLSVADGSVFFYTSATAEISTTTLTLSQGKATFYVSGETPVETILSAAAVTGGSKYSYTAARAVLLIEELPPWPIIGEAFMYDTDCDNVPDRLEVILTAPYQDGQTFSSLAFEYRGDTIRVNSADIVDSSLTVSFTPKDTSAFTNPEGTVILESSVSGEIKSSTDFYRDRISPTILSLSVLERLDTARADKIYIEFSEPISAPGLSLPVNLFDKDGSPVSMVPTVTGAKLYNESLNVWEFTVPFNADGTSAITEGMMGQLSSSAQITDKAGNGISSVCKAPLLTFELKIMPVPLKYASISDADGDGLAERIVAEFTTAVDERHAPDSIAAIFGTAVPETLIAKTFDWNDARTTAVLNVSSPFKLGNTSGNYSGLSSKGGDLVGAGLLVQHKGQGANYESDSTLAEDLAGPVIVGATVIQAGSFLSLRVEPSEPLVIKDSSLSLIERERKGPVKVIPSRWNLGSTTFTMLYEQESETAVEEGDRIRFAPLDESLFRDQSGNLPASENPWATVSGSGKPRISFHVNPHSPVSDVSSGSSESCSEASADFRLAVLNQETRKWDIYEKDELVASTDTNGYVFDGMLFDIELGVPRGTSAGESPAWKKLSLNMDLPFYTNLGSFVNRYHQTLALDPRYLSSDNQMILKLEWLSGCTKGLVSSDGRAVGTGAYISQVKLKTRFVPDTDQESDMVKRFSTSDSYSKTQTFGIRRIK